MKIWTWVGAVAALLCSVVYAGGAETAGAKYAPFGVGLLNEAQLKDLPAEVLATVNGAKITREFLESKIADASENEQPGMEQSRPFLLAQFVQREILLQKARKDGLLKKDADETAENEAIHALMQKCTDGVEVKDSELREVYEKYKRGFGGASFEEAKPTLQKNVLAQKKQMAVLMLMEETGKNAKVAVNAAWAAEQNKLLTDNDLDRGLKAGKIMMVEFTGEGCVYCKQMAPIIKELEAEQKDVNIVSIDIDKHRELMLRYDVQGVPVQVFFSAKGEEVYRHEGLWTKKGIVEKLDALRAGKVVAPGHYHSVGKKAAPKK